MRLNLLPFSCLLLGLMATYCCPPSRTLAAFKPQPSSLAALPYQTVDSLIFVDTTGAEWVFHSRDGWQEQDWTEPVCSFCHSWGVRSDHEVSLRLNYIDFIGVDSLGDSIYLSLGCHTWFAIEDSLESDPASCTRIASSVPAESLLPLDVVGVSVDSSAPDSNFHHLWFSDSRYVMDHRQAPDSADLEGIFLNWREVTDTTFSARAYETLWVPELVGYDDEMYYSPQVGIVAFRYRNQLFTLP